MPTVPGYPSAPSAPSEPPPSQEWLLMAAAVQEDVFLKKLKAGESGSPAQLYNMYRQSGLDRETARQRVLQSLGAATGSHEGMTNEEVEADISNEPMS